MLFGKVENRQSSTNKTPDLRPKRFFVAREADDHRLKEALGHEPFNIERMVGAMREQNEKSCLRTSIALPKRVNGVQRCKECRGPVRKLVRRQMPEKVAPFQVREQLFHLPGDMLRVAKGAVALAYAYRPVRSRPRIHVLEQVIVNGAIMGNALAAREQRFVGALRGHRRLELIERGLIAKVRNIFENSRTVVAVRINDRVVHRTPLSDLRVLAGNGLSTILRREVFSFEFTEVFARFLTQTNAFNGANLGECATTNRI
jgi:hypothetical protein